MTHQIHRAGWIIIDPDTIIQNGFIKVESGRITEVGQGKIHSTEHIIDHGSGVLLPAPVNVHTHLELSALKGKIPFEYGFRHWVRELIQQREAIGIEALKSGAIQGIKELKESGCCAVGEISTLGITKEIFSESSLAGVWFREFLGDNNPENQKLLTSHFSLLTSHFSLPASQSFAGHAPHTTSPELLVKLKNITRKYNRPFSIHLAESDDETEFLTTGKGAWADFLTERGIDFSDWGLPVKSPVKHTEQIGILDENTIAVHLIHADHADFETLLRHNVNICLCLRSNQNLHHRLPDIEGMLRVGIKPCIGTDSLASTDSLNIFDEMAFISCKFANILPAEILSMATVNGAKALGISDFFGSLIHGKYPAFVYLPLNISNQAAILDSVVNAVENRLKVC